MAAVLLEQRPELLHRLAAAMGLPPEAAKCWCSFLLGLHDLGKFAETFQQLREDLRIALWPNKHIRKHNYSISVRSHSCSSLKMSPILASVSSAS